MHQRVVSAFDQYFDVTELSDQEISQLVRSYGIDIAIDLAGYTQHCRTEIFAHRCAPIQINYLGYPGTMGAKFMDYIIADKVVIPEEQQQFYSEKIIYLPGSYQPNDSKRYSSDVYKNKGDFALPRNKFVFCCFNNNFKITPDVFDCWIEILSNVDNSVLWLLSDNHFAKFNLLNYLSKKSFDLSRVFFGDRIAYADHLERYRVADLFLDTFPYNAHTTASEALWSCLPVLTHCGHSFSSRVCSSLLSSLNLNELIAFSKEEYIQKAINLANDPDMLFEIKSKLKHAVYSSNFSGELFALNFEKILKNIYFSH